MKSPICFNSAACISALVFFNIAAPVKLHADEWNALPSQPAGLGGMTADPATNGQLFASPDDAVKTLRTAVEADDTAALGQIFGPLYQSLLTGDKVQDEKNRRHFANAMEESCRLDRQSDGEIFVTVGTNDWPMPIPLKQANGQWYFDTAEGREQVIDRHIGKDELAAIGICRAYVDAQREYAGMNGGLYAQKFESSPGQKDGLYWPTAEGETPRPFSALVASASEQGSGHKGQAFHGYYFKILTRQGADAPGGKMDYMNGDNLKNGFALVAYPEHWSQSGVMTFIVGQDGKVYQHDFGDKTYRTASKLKEYNPDSDWSLVQDEGSEHAAFIQ